MEPVLRLVTPPSDEPLTVEEAKHQCRQVLDIPGDEAWFTRAVKAARFRVEADTDRQLLTAPYELDLYGFPCWRLLLPKSPLQSTTVVITYVDDAGQTQTLDPSQYQVVRPTGPRCGHGRIERAYNVTWPSTRWQYGAVKVAFQAGYGVAADVPDDLVQAQLMLIGHWYENRETVVIGTISTEIQLAYTSMITNYVLDKLPVLG